MSNESEIFKASTESLQSLFNESAFFLPEYQRAYRWPEPNVLGLFESMLRGLERLGDHDVDVDEAFTFLGAIVTLEEVPGSNHPPGASQVIDGQQRLTTLVLTLVALHAELVAQDGRRANVG